MNRRDILNNAPAVTIAVFLVVFGLSAFLLWSQYQKMSAAHTKVVQQEALLESEKKHSANLEEIAEELVSYKTQLADISSALPDDPLVPSLFNFVQRSSAESGLLLQSISPFSVSVSEDMPDLRETQFSVAVSGSYDSLKNFIGVLEKSARIIEVESVSFSYPKVGESFSFSLRLKVFSY